MNAPRIRHRAGFSLLELMIAIVILGLGLVMVGTMFPIAWDRARELNEQSISQTVLGVAHDQFTNSVQVAGGSAQTGFTSAHLAGDLLFDPLFNNGAGANIAPADQRVHALNMENMLVGSQTPFVGENTWRLERQPPISLDPDGQDFWWDEVFIPYPSAQDFINNTFHTPRILLHQRVYPPMRARNGTNFMTVPDPAWGTQLATRNFCWSVLYRIHDFGAPEGAIAANGNIIGTPTETAPPWSGSPEWSTGPEATAIGREAFHRPRSVDVYYVSLRRPSPTNRYMQQAWMAPAEVPNPYAFDRPPHLYDVAPAGFAQDLMFPVPWRVQLEFPNNLAMANTTTGIPTEVAVPACQAPTICDDDSDSLGDDIGRMLVGMFPSGSRFVDEVNGQVYRVIKRRLINEQGSRAMLTLDREVLMEDLDFTDPRTPPAYGSGSRSCNNCETIATQIANNDPPELDVEERIRTVWVFPPPVEARVAGEPVTYSGPQPVVTIEVRNVLMAPQTTRN